MLFVPPAKEGEAASFQNSILPSTTYMFINSVISGGVWELDNIMDKDIQRATIRSFGYPQQNEAPFTFATGCSAGRLDLVTEICFNVQRDSYTWLNPVIAGVRIKFQSGYYMNCYNGGCAANGWTQPYTNYTNGKDKNGQGSVDSVTREQWSGCMTISGEMLLM